MLTSGYIVINKIDLSSIIDNLDYIQDYINNIDEKSEHIDSLKFLEEQVKKISMRFLSN